MIRQARQHRHSLILRLITYVIIASFSLTLLTPPTYAQAILNLPVPGTMVLPSTAYTPVHMLGMTLHPENPLEIDFIIHRGDDALDGDPLEEESEKLLSYFYAAMTVPEEEMWVNLSPYEENRIIADGLGDTMLGRDMLAQDYMLKQLSASIAYPEEEMGREFWQRVRAKVQEEYGNAEIPMNTFNKIWIVPDTASIYVHETSVFVVENYLKVMLEEDYLALEHNSSSKSSGDPITGLTNEIVREILIPEIEYEVNYGKHFAPLRQMFHSMVLATWYKKNLKSSILTQSIANQNKTDGQAIQDPQAIQTIYDQYVEAFKVGVYDYIKEETDPVTQELIPRKYFSGGVDGAMATQRVDRIPASFREIQEVDLAVLATRAEVEPDAAMITVESQKRVQINTGNFSAQDVINFIESLQEKLRGATEAGDKFISLSSEWAPDSYLMSAAKDTEKFGIDKGDDGRGWFLGENIQKLAEWLEEQKAIVKGKKESNETIKVQRVQRVQIGAGSFLAEDVFSAIESLQNDLKAADARLGLGEKFITVEAEFGADLYLMFAATNIKKFGISQRDNPKEWHVGDNIGELVEWLEAQKNFIITEGEVMSRQTAIKVSDLTYAQLQNLGLLDAQRVNRAKMGDGWTWFSEEENRDGELKARNLTPNVMTLNDVASMVPPSVQLFLDFKADFSDPENIRSDFSAEEVNEFLKRGGIAGRSVVWAWEFNFLKELRKLNPEVTLGYLLDASGERITNPVDKPTSKLFIQEAVARAEEAQVGISFDYNWLMKLDEHGLAEDFIDQIHALDQKVSIWTLNFEENKEIIQRIFELGVDEVETDQPKRMEEFRQELIKDKKLGKGSVVIAHRNNDSYVLETAVKNGAYGVEVDIQNSQDGFPVIIHDDLIPSDAAMPTFAKATADKATLDLSDEAQSAKSDAAMLKEDAQQLITSDSDEVIDSVRMKEIAEKIQNLKAQRIYWWDDTTLEGFRERSGLSSEDIGLVLGRADSSNGSLTVYVYSGSDFLEKNHDKGTRHVDFIYAPGTYLSSYSIISHPTISRKPYEDPTETAELLLAEFFNQIDKDPGIKASEAEKRALEAVSLDSDIDDSSDSQNGRDDVTIEGEYSTRDAPLLEAPRDPSMAAETDAAMIDLDLLSDAIQSRLGLSVEQQTWEDGGFGLIGNTTRIGIFQTPDGQLTEAGILASEDFEGGLDANYKVVKDANGNLAGIFIQKTINSLGLELVSYLNIDYDNQQEKLNNEPRLLELVNSHLQKSSESELVPLAERDILTAKEHAFYAAREELEKALNFSEINTASNGASLDPANALPVGSVNDLRDEGLYFLMFYNTPGGQSIEPGILMRDSTQENLIMLNKDGKRINISQDQVLRQNGSIQFIFFGEENLEKANISLEEVVQRTSQVYLENAPDTIVALSELGAVDQAMHGGIDFNANNLKLMGEDGAPIDFNFPTLDINPANVNGVYPVILNITPLHSLPMLLGLKPEEEEYAELSSL